MHVLWSIKLMVRVAFLEVTVFETFCMDARIHWIFTAFHDFFHSLHNFISLSELKFDFLAYLIASSYTSFYVLLLCSEVVIVEILTTWI